jgi:hypothetical protein
VLRRIFGLKRDEVIGGWRKLHNEERHSLYSSPSIIRTIKSRRMRWTGYVAGVGEKRNTYRILVGKSEGNRPVGIILKWTLKGLDGVVWTTLIWLRTDTSGGLL